MGAPNKWLPQLAAIRKSVAASPRSHYTRADIERLFGIQSRAANRLMELLPTVAANNSKMVEKEALEGFLERVRVADDVHILFAAIRAEKAASSRKAIRRLNLNDVESVNLFGLPENLTLERGRMEVKFKTGDELGRILIMVATLLMQETDEFMRLYEPAPEPDPDAEAAREDVRRMFADLEEREKAFSQTGNSENQPDRYPLSRNY
jgi:hypothetical protein